MFQGGGREPYASLRHGLPEGFGEEEEHGIVYEGTFYHIGGRNSALSDRDILLLKPGRIHLNGMVAYVQRYLAWRPIIILSRAQEKSSEDM